MVSPLVTAPPQEQVRRKYQRAAPGSVAEGEWVQQYLPLVKHVVGRIAVSLPPHVDAEDLHSAGVIGLLQALRNYDPASTASLETYASIRIRGAVLDELRRMDWVSRSVREKARKVQSVMQEVEQRKGAVPDEAEMAAALQLTGAEYRALLEEIRPVTFVCLDAVAGSGGEDDPAQHESIADPSQPSPVDDTARREMARLIAARIQELPDMQRKVLALYYFEDLRLREIAAAFGLTESRICQIHAQAILAIKSFLQQHEGQTT